MPSPDAAMLPSGPELVAWLARRPSAERDRAVEALFGVGEAPAAPPGPDLVGYVPSGIAPLVRAVIDAPITAADAVVVLGAGLGKAVQAIALLSGAKVRGIELQPDLAARARARGLDVVTGDARTAAIDDATVVYLYLPFTGASLAAVAARIAHLRVCALGVDLPGRTARPSEHLWLSIYDPPGSGPLPPRVDLGPAAEAVADER